MAFLQDPKERRAAHGRMQTAVANSGNDQVIAIYEASANAKGDKNAKMRRLLEDWLIDPSFGQALLNNSTIIEEYKQAKGKDEVVSYSRLEVLEGKLGAKELEPKLQ